MADFEKQLTDVISIQLDNCCKKTLPRLAEKIKEPAGRAMVEAMIFNICTDEGVSIQTAMSEIDSEL